jgi:hypothetical protein
MSEAIASLEGQRSITARNDAAEDMPRHLGRFVLNDKDKTSYDCGRRPGFNILMGSKQPLSKFEQDFIARTARARIARGITQQVMADGLGIPQDRYKNYESGRLLPHEFIPQFCLICGCDPTWLFTATGQPPVQRQPEGDSQPKTSKLKAKSRRKVA